MVIANVGRLLGLFRVLGVLLLLGGISLTALAQNAQDGGAQPETDLVIAVMQRLLDSQELLRENQELLQRRLENQQEAIATLEARHGPWEPFGRDIKAAVREVVKYEYALVRNGGFRTLTASTWNGGWRVATAPYMTGDSGRFKLGGSMWVWGTRDSRDDNGLFHLYYYFQGGGAAATGGNGLRSGGSDSGEGVIYRRLR